MGSRLFAMRLNFHRGDYAVTEPEELEFENILGKEDDDVEWRGENVVWDKSRNRCVRLDPGLQIFTVTVSIYYIHASSISIIA
jgi:hypothetical protein